MYASEKQMQYNTVDEEKQKDIYKHEVQEKGLAHLHLFTGLSMKRERLGP